MNKIIITITGPSAAGKSTLEALMIERFPERFARLISTTTRSKRAHESESAYHFVSRDRFAEIDLIESVEFNGHLYGVSSDEVRRAIESGKIPVVVVEPHGRDQIFRWAENNGFATVAIFVDGELDVRLKRLVERFISDRAVGTVDFPESKVTTFVNRLLVTCTDEAMWSDESWMYDIMIGRFNAENTEAVLTKVIERIDYALRQLAAGVDLLKDVDFETLYISE